MDHVVGEYNEFKFEFGWIEVDFVYAIEYIYKFSLFTYMVYCNTLDPPAFPFGLPLKALKRVG